MTLQQAVLGTFHTRERAKAFVDLWPTGYPTKAKQNSVKPNNL